MATTPSRIEPVGPSGWDGELPKLPPPPADLPRPWSQTKWRSFYTVGFFVFLFVLYLVGAALGNEILGDFTWSWTITCSTWLVLGLFLIWLFQSRPYLTQVRKRGLQHRFLRYRRKGNHEALFSLYPRLQIGEAGCFLVYYVPGMTVMGTRHLAEGAEPLLFDTSGTWIEDEPLFHKAMLMWAVAIEISPGTLSYRLVKESREFSRLIRRYLEPLPSLLDRNERMFLNLGYQHDFAEVRRGVDAKLGYTRHSQHIIETKAHWGEAHGWDSMTVLRYEDALRLHEAKVEAFQARARFTARHRLDDVEASARRLSAASRGNRSAGWTDRKTLEEGLLALAVHQPTGETNFTKVDGQWHAPNASIEAYRSRLAYVRAVDSQEKWR